jgi:hypothetical protein
MDMYILPIVVEGRLDSTQRIIILAENAYSHALSTTNDFWEGLFYLGETP